MLRFQNKPDVIFLEMLHEAMELMISDIEGTGFDPEAFQDQYEKSSRLFDPQLARDTLQSLLLASHSPQWYQPTDYHWLLLYEALAAYCVVFNDEDGRGYRIAEEHDIRHIEFAAVVDLFFWDTDFLMAKDDVLALGTEGRAQFAINPETFALTQGLKPHAEELQLQPIEPDKEAMPPSSIYRPGSRTYPDWEAMS